MTWHGHHHRVLMISITEASSWSPSPKHHHDLHHHQLDTLISIVASLSSRQLLLLQLSLPLSDKVKQLHGDCISYKKATTIWLLPIADNFYKTWSSHTTSLYHIMSWPYHITTCPAKISWTSSTLLLQVLRGCYGLLPWTVHTYGTKTTTVIYQVCYFNLHKDRPQSNLIQLKLEKQTPTSHLYAKLVACLSVESVSWTHKVGPGRFIQKYCWIKIRHRW